MHGEFNKLTQRLLAQGYSWQNFPETVRLPGGCIDHNTPRNPLINIYGGFEYKRAEAEQRVYETPCGLQALGVSTFSGLSWYGVEYCHENDNPVINCPKSCKDCTACRMRPAPFDTRDTTKATGKWCPVHMSGRPYQRAGSLEELSEQREKEKREQLEEFKRTHKNACSLQIFFDLKTEKWAQRYNPHICLTECQSEGFCPVLQREKGKARGNIYYDIEIEGRDYSKDGTLFEGERFRIIYKGFQFFDKPVNMTIAEAYLKTQKKEMETRIRYGQLSRVCKPLDLFRAELGEIDLKWNICNFRVERKNTRDLEQDLQDIENGIEIQHAVDMERGQKEAKRQRKEARQEAEKKRQAKKLLEAEEITERERIRAAKVLGEEEFERIQIERRARKKQPAPKEPEQLSLFEFM